MRSGLELLIVPNDIQTTKEICHAGHARPKHLLPLVL